MFKPKTELGSYTRDQSHLETFLDNKVRIWLNERARLFLLDYINIKYVSQTYYIPNIWDYSYLIMPAFKALEGTMLQIGEQLGFDITKYKYKVGLMFSEENLEKFYNDVLDKTAKISEEKRLDIKQWLDNARRILSSLRHNPAHFNGDTKTFEKAFLDGDLILSTINYMCLALIESGVFIPYLEKKAKFTGKSKNEDTTIIAVE